MTLEPPGNTLTSLRKLISAPQNNQFNQELIIPKREIHTKEPENNAEDQIIPSGVIKQSITSTGLNQVRSTDR
jgi:hypothetical protein